jgi:RNA polymerase sigma factor (sigma-70 family)
MDLFTANISEREEQARRFRARDTAFWDLVCQRVGVVVAILKKREGLFNIDWDDWAQETAKRLWTTRTRYDPKKSTMAAWIWIVGKNVALDMIKSTAVRGQRIESRSNCDFLACPSQREADPMKPSQAVLDVREVVTELPPRERRIIEYNGEPKDLASEIGLSSATIRVYKHRILAKLRKKLTSRGYS